MAWRWHLPLDLFTTATLDRFVTRVGTMGVVHADVVVSAGEGYNGGNALTGSSSDAYVIAFVRNSDTEDGRVGCRVRIDAYPGSPHILLGVVDQDFGLQSCVVLEVDGTLTLHRGEAVTQLGASTAVIADDGIYYPVGLGFTIHPSTGMLEVYVGNTIEEANLFARVSAVNTEGATNAGWLGIYLGLGPDLFIDLPYAFDGPGDPVPGYNIDYGYPDPVSPSGEEYGEWASTESSVEAAIDEAQADDAVTFIYPADGSPAPTAPRFAVPIETVTTRTINYGVMPVAVVMNPDEAVSPPDLGAPNFEFLLNLSGAVHTMGTQSVLINDWIALWWAIASYPSTGIPWTSAQLNAAANKYGGRVIQ